MNEWMNELADEIVARQNKSHIKLGSLAIARIIARHAPTVDDKYVINQLRTALTRIEAEIEKETKQQRVESLARHAPAPDAELAELANSVCDKAQYVIGGEYFNVMKRDEAVKIALDEIKKLRAALARLNTKGNGNG
jgi:hypothetical protein